MPGKQSINSSNIYRIVIGYVTIMAHLLPYEASWGSEVLHEGRLCELGKGTF